MVLLETAAGVGVLCEKVPAPPGPTSSVARWPQTHPGLERHELEHHLQGEDDGESHVENVRDVVHLLGLVVVLREGPGGG